MKPRHSEEQEKNQNDKVESNRIILPPIASARRNYGDTRNDLAFGASNKTNTKKTQPFDTSKKSADAQKETRSSLIAPDKMKKRKGEASQGKATPIGQGSELEALGPELESEPGEGQKSPGSSDSADESSVYSDKHLKQNDKINYVKSATQGNVDQKQIGKLSTNHLKAMGAFVDIYANINENNIRINIKNQERRRAKHREEKLKNKTVAEKKSALRSILDFRFHPNAGFKLKWDLLVIILSLYNSFVIPLQFSIPGTFDGVTWIVVLDNIIDVCFYFDILITFRS